MLIWTQLPNPGTRYKLGFKNPRHKHPQHSSMITLFLTCARIINFIRVKSLALNQTLLMHQTKSFSSSRRKTTIFL